MYVRMYVSFTDRAYVEIMRYLEMFKDMVNYLEIC